MTPSLSQAVPACSSEHDLVAAVRAGSDRAFEELYSRYRSQLWTYIFGMVRDHARAEDIAQDVFVSALRRMRATGRPIAFRPWIYEIARNACIDEYRRTRRAREVPLEVDGGPDPLPTSASNGSAPEVAMERKQSLTDLRGAFGVLPENHRQIIVLREFEGLSYSEIGDRLGLTRPMVESTLFRARRKLSEEYDELASGRRCTHVQNLVDTDQLYSLRRLGVRERRKVARHLAHCQPCRRHARLAGVDESLFTQPGLIGKIAALLPIPWLRARRGPSGASSAHRLAALEPVQSVSGYADLLSNTGGLGRAVAAVAAIAVAGVGGGVVGAIAEHDATQAHAGTRLALTASSLYTPAQEQTMAAGASRGYQHAVLSRVAAKNLQRPRHAAAGHAVKRQALGAPATNGPAIAPSAPIAPTPTSGSYSRSGAAQPPSGGLPSPPASGAGPSNLGGVLHPITIQQPLLSSLPKPAPKLLSTLEGKVIRLPSSVPLPHLHGYRPR